MTSLLLLLGCGVLLTASVAARGEDLLDRVDEALTVSLLDDTVRARLSGLADLEFYHYSNQPTGLIFSEKHSLLNPRLAVFFDAQIGTDLYLFAQARLDRGFDAGEGRTEVRLDEYVLRWSPGGPARFSLQVGQFATIVGNYAERHLSWDNPFINEPLLYGNMTAIYDGEAPATTAAFTQGLVDSRYDYNPVVWGPSYASGLAISGQISAFDFAAEVKNAALSSRPETWSVMQTGFSHPTYSARLGWRPSIAWKLGVSASEGAYLIPAATPTLPKGGGIGSYAQKVLAQDLSYAWHHWQFWAEAYEARFEVPRVGNADTFGYYLEAKYKFNTQLFGALRWNQQVFDKVPNGTGGEQPWGHDLWRADVALTYRWSAHTQTKLQYSLQHENGADHPVSHLLATQFTIRF